MPLSLIAFDTDHIKRYVFGTNRLKEIRGASSILDHLNRITTVREAEKRHATKIYANGGSALFLIDSRQAEDFGKTVQRLYSKRTGGGASITYAIQPIPDYGEQDPMTATQLNPRNPDNTMKNVLNLLRLRLRLAKGGQSVDTSQREQDQESQQTNQSEQTNTQQKQVIDMRGSYTYPSHPLLCTCNSCGVNYAEYILSDPDDTDEPEGRYCRVCKGKRDEDRNVKKRMESRPLSKELLWGHILDVLSAKDTSDIPLYDYWEMTRRPKDFNVFREFTRGKEYLGLIYADANGMGNAFAQLKSLKEIQDTAELVDKAVFQAMGDAIREYLPVQDDKFPFDILMIGGDDIVMVAPADKALQVAHMLAEQFHLHTNQQYTLSIGVLLAPVTYPFSQQLELVEATLKAAKKSGAIHNQSSKSEQEQSRINFLVVTGNTSLSYQKQYDEMHYKETVGSKNEYYATRRPYALSDIASLLAQLKEGNQRRLGRTKLHQLREAILKMNNTTSILESLALLRNWKKDERDFIKDMVKNLDTHRTPKQQQMGILFPWYPEGTTSKNTHMIYQTPLLDFVELYDFVSFQEGVE